MLFVSHDRYFIQKVAESLLIFDEHGVMYYPFGYTHYIEHCQKQADGMDTSARIRAEEQALISGLQNVPKAEKHRLKEISEDSAYKDWQMRLISEPMEQARFQLETFLDTYDLEKDWVDISYQENYQHTKETLLKEYTESCLDWYDKWLEFHPEIPNHTEQESKGAAL